VLFLLRSRRRIPLGEFDTNKEQKKSRPAVALPLEKDERKLSTRQRQIDIGKNTVGYERYLEDVERYKMFFNLCTMGTSFREIRL